jgi:glycosyltransferase involved in cell wall biosynthesis
MKKLSIIIRCHNRLEYTIRTIVSIDEKCGLNKDDYEIICVDQCSTDGTREWLLSAEKDGYYPISPIFLSSNYGDGLGMQYGIEHADGEFIAQHDNDIILFSDNYYKLLIEAYKLFECSRNVCAVSGTHAQGIDFNDESFRHGKKRYPDNWFESSFGIHYFCSWVTASFIFRREFISHKFDKKMCNVWGGYWWDRGYDNIKMNDIKFWHIDSDLKKTGAYVQKQYDKFPNYDYIAKHYSKFIKR